MAKPTKKPAPKSKGGGAVSRERAKSFQDPKFFANIAPGILNPHVRRPIVRRRINTQDNNDGALSMLATAMLQPFQTDALKGISEFRGILLKVLNPPGPKKPADPFSWMKSWFDDSSTPPAEPPVLLEVKVRIPELHPYLPVPTGPDDDAAISFYPTFIAENTAVSQETYTPGDVVIVRYMNPNDYTNGILVSKLMKAAPTGQTTIICAGATYNGGAGGSTMAGSGRASSQTAAPVQDTRDERKCVALIGTNSFQGKFGEMIEQYFYSAGWAIMGESGISVVNPGGSLKNKPTKGWRMTKINHTLQDFVITKGPISADIQAKLKKFKPEAVVLQFDSILRPGSVDKTAAALKNIMSETVKKIRSLAGNKVQIYLIGTPNTHDLNVEATANVAGNNGVKFLGTTLKGTTVNIFTRNQAWMAAAFGTTKSGRIAAGTSTYGKNVFVCDPLMWRFPKQAYGQTNLDDKKPSNRDLGLYVVKDFIKKFIGNARAPGPPKRKPRIPDNPYISGLLNALTPDLTDPTAAKQYLLQIATKLGYDTSPNPTANSPNPHWKSLIKRSFLVSAGTQTVGSGQFHDDELAKIFGFKKKKLTTGEKKDLGYTPTQPTTSDANTFPKKEVADQLRTQLSEQVHKAARLYEKQQKEAEKTIGQKKQEQAQQTPTTPCPPGMGGTDQMMIVPAGSTYKGPKTLKRNKLGGAVRPGSANVKVVLSPWTFKHWKRNEGDKWKTGLKAFDAVSVKVMDGGREFASKLSLETLQICEGMGVYTQGWGYHYMTDIASATREAKAAAKVVKKLKLRAYYCNAEKQWAGVWGSPITQDPSGAAMQFAYIFKKECPGIPLLWYGLTRKVLAYKSGKKREIFSDAALAFYDGYAPMRYATKISTQVSSTRKGGIRAQQVKIPYCPTWHIGPKWKKGSIWGYANDSKGKPGIFSFCRNQGSDVELWPKITWACFYYGSGKGPSGTVGHEKNPSLEDIARGIRSGAAKMPNGAGKGFTEGKGCKNLQEGGICLDQDKNKSKSKPVKPKTTTPAEKKAKQIAQGTGL